ncbi:type I glyceraldehyde-3-phosphate dehydrogenase [Candidatus Gracilibacteria bacterium]|nr:type I glyceraldehyde-3-phosphate dehydrogenase [Candidatus Gracilibacteria bacterium]MCF7856651.1 type I glyceraldehyde-3-phosphate dehydrogenase [Candidatus Gracilibacteria bacterium]MCF7896968.1 type I glyceraldehyde-3-phosphate dehydrogenase [Candidatus Gracilibacteria bacterium]
MTSKIRVAINGYGRIGRCFHRQALNDSAIEIVAINSRSDAATNAHLLKYDSIYGVLLNEISVSENYLEVDGQKTQVFEGMPGKDFDWGELKIDVVIEATGRLTNFSTAEQHLAAGAKKVLVTAPCNDIRIPTFVMGVNHSDYDPSSKILSNASCTTNCLAPLAKVLHENFGIKRAQLSTVHAVTGNQNILDNSADDLRRARSFLPSIVPTKTGVSSALGRVIPELANKFSGVSLRVPTAIVSLVDLTAQLEKKVSTKEVNAAIEKASKNELKGILGIEKIPLVSIDFKGDSRSSIVDAENTKVVGEKLVKVLAWYDNEWGYSARVVDLVKLCGAS